MRQRSPALSVMQGGYPAARVDCVCGLTCSPAWCVASVRSVLVRSPRVWVMLPRLLRPRRAPGEVRSRRGVGEIRRWTHGRTRPVRIRRKRHGIARRPRSGSKGRLDRRSRSSVAVRARMCQASSAMVLVARILRVRRGVLLLALRLSLLLHEGLRLTRCCLCQGAVCRLWLFVNWPGVCCSIQARAERHRGSRSTATRDRTQCGRGCLLLHHDGAAPCPLAMGASRPCRQSGVWGVAPLSNLCAGPLVDRRARQILAEDCQRCLLARQHDLPKRSAVLSAR
jgi:hypothetical protein